jgi:hypothetical protein
VTRGQYALLRRDATGRTGRRPNLYGHCLTCGATVSDWRRLLGVGARIVPCHAEPASAVLVYPGACNDCGASELLLTTLRARSHPGAFIGGRAL